MSRASSTAGSRPRLLAPRAATTPSPMKAAGPSAPGSSHGATCASSSTMRSREVPRMNSDRPPETVRGYLDQLRRALKGAPAGLVADALADCEEHLNNEIAQNPE